MIVVEPYGTAPEVMPGFTKRLRFRFSPQHDQAQNLLYEILGFYDITVSVQHAIMGNAYVGRGDLVLLGANLASREQLNHLVGSRMAPQTSTWEVQVELSSTIVGEIDAARRPSGDAPVVFTFDWYLWVRERYDESGGTKYGNVRNERIWQRTGQSSSAPVVVSVAASDWFKITEAYGFPGRRLIELVFPAVDKDRWPGAINDLAQADRDFDSRRDPQVLDFCERALEEVLGKNVVMGRPDAAKAEIAALLERYGLVDERKREMLVNLVHDAMVFVRRGKHGVDAAGHPEFDPSSGDAELGLLVTKALLGFLSKRQG